MDIWYGHSEVRNGKPKPQRTFLDHVTFWKKFDRNFEKSIWEFCHFRYFSLRLWQIWKSVENRRNPLERFFEINPNFFKTTDFMKITNDTLLIRSFWTTLLFIICVYFQYLRYCDRLNMTPPHSRGSRGREHLKWTFMSLDYKTEV